MAHHYLTAAMFLDAVGKTIYKKYLCPRCDGILKDAVQPSCGHWLCEECAKQLFSAERSPMCPRLDCGEVLTQEDGVPYFPDRFVRKEIQNAMVKCYFHDKGCTSWVGKLKDYAEHLKQCRFAVETCEHCSEKIKALDLEAHKASCAKAGKSCPFGCTGTMSSEELAQHFEDFMVPHFEYVATTLKELQDRVGMTRQRDDDDIDSAYGSDNKPLQKLRELDDFVERDGPRTATLVGGEDHSPCKQKFRTEVADPFTDFRGLSAAIESTRDRIEREIQPQLRSRNDEICTLQKTVAKLEKQLRAKTSELEERDFRLSLIENSSYNGTTVWKIPQFEQRMADARTGKYTSIFSLPFYTSRYGYKMCLRLYILGDGIGKNTHMSLFFVIMRNEFDNILQWPFTHRVTFKLINQSGGRDIVDTFQPDPASSSFKKPKSDMNIASGCPKFVSHEELRKGFIVDDTLFIKCSVDCSTICTV